MDIAEDKTFFKSPYKNRLIFRNGSDEKEIRNWSLISVYYHLLEIENDQLWYRRFLQILPLIENHQKKVQEAQKIFTCNGYKAINNIASEH